MGINKSSQKSTSSNQAYGFLKDSLGGVVDNVNVGARGIADLLAGNTTGWEAFKGATGFDRTMANGMAGITGAGAARGLLRSGATGKALTSYGQQLQNESAQNYIQNLLGLSGIGMNAAQTIGSAGNVSSSSGKSKGLSLNPMKKGGG